jgi:hypothetical protein
VARPPWCWFLITACLQENARGAPVVDRRQHVAVAAVYSAVKDAPMHEDQGGTTTGDVATPVKQSPSKVTPSDHSFAIEFTNRRKWRAQRDVLHAAMTTCGSVCRMIWTDNYPMTKVGCALSLCSLISLSLSASNPKSL